MSQEREKTAALHHNACMDVPKFTFSWEEPGCSMCGQPHHVRLTHRRTVISIAYGKFVAIERQGYCPDHPDLPPARSSKLPMIVASGCNMGYDIIARVGLTRFLECRQCEEVQLELSCQYGIEIPVRTISHLAHKFIAYFQVVHQESIQLLRKAMSAKCVSLSPTPAQRPHTGVRRE